MEVGFQMASGLAGVHGLGYVHGDFKVDNIGLSNEGSSLLVKLLDFGRVQEISKRTRIFRSGMP